MKPVAWGIEITGELADVGLHKQQMELEFHRRQGKYPDPTRKFVELYTADQLREVEQQRDELLAAAKQACDELTRVSYDHRNRLIPSSYAAAKALRAAIAKVKP